MERVAEQVSTQSITRASEKRFRAEIFMLVLNITCDWERPKDAFRMRRPCRWWGVGSPSCPMIRRAHETGALMAYMRDAGALMDGMTAR
jgi:hypothetical protein